MTEIASENSGIGIHTELEKAQRFIDSIKNPTKKEEFQSALNTLKKTHSTEHSHTEMVREREALIKTISMQVERYQSIEDVFGDVYRDGEGFQDFWKYFSSFPENIQVLLMETFSNNAIKVKKYFRENGYLNPQTIQIFYDKFQLDISSGNLIESVSEEEVIVSTSYQKVINIKNKIGVDDLHKKGLTKLAVFFQTVSVPNTDNFKEKREYLNAFLEALKGEKFEMLLELVKEQDTAKNLVGNESLYQQLRDIAKGTPELLAKFELFESKRIIVQPPPDNLQQAQIRATLGGENFTQVGNRFEATTSNGIVAYNPRTGERTLRSTRESSYELRTEIPLGDFYPETVKYEKARQELEPKINRNKSIIQILENIKGLYDNTPIAELEKSFRSIFKEHFYSMYSSFKKTFFEVTGKNMSEIKTISEIKSDLVRVLAVLKEELTKSENELLLSKQNYQVALETYMKAYKEKLKAKDARLKEVLSFFHSIGFDILPKSITDTIIELVNAKIPGEIAGIKFDTDINIKEGILGLRDRSAGKELFIQFFHKILGGDEKHPLFKTNGVGKIIGVYVDNESRSDDVSGKIKDLVRNIGRNFTLETAKSNLGL